MAFGTRTHAAKRPGCGFRPCPYQLPSNVLASAGTALDHGVSRADKPYRASDYSHNRGTRKVTGEGPLTGRR